MDFAKLAHFLVQKARKNHCISHDYEKKTAAGMSEENKVLTNP